MNPTFPGSRLLLTGLLASSVLLAVGCTSSRRSLPVYRPGQVNQARTSEVGRINSVRAVVIERDTGVRTSAGARAGSSVGRAIATGQNPGVALAGAAGSVVGEIAGRAIEGMASRVEGQEIEVHLDDGNTVTVVQENNPPYVGGERVRLVRTGTHVEVLPEIDETANRYAGP